MFKAYLLMGLWIVLVIGVVLWEPEELDDYSVDNIDE